LVLELQKEFAGVVKQLTLVDTDELSYDFLVVNSKSVQTIWSCVMSHYEKYIEQNTGESGREISCDINREFGW
jgi:hypothetical protein